MTMTSFWADREVLPICTPEYWDLAWVEHSPLQSEYRQWRIDWQLAALHGDMVGSSVAEFSASIFYSHEALLWHY